VVRKTKQNPLLAVPDGTVNWTKPMQEALLAFGSGPGQFQPGASFDVHHDQHKQHMWWRDIGVPAACYLLDLHGVVALPLFLQWSAARQCPALVQTALVNIHSEQTVDALIERRQDVDFRALLVRQAKKWPIFVLCKLLDLNPPKRQAAALLILEILDKDPRYLPLLREHANEARLGTLERLLALADVAEEAGEAELPEVLRALPWLNRQPSRIPTLELPAIKDDPRFDWSKWKGREDPLSELERLKGRLDEDYISKNVHEDFASADLARKVLRYIGVKAEAIERAIETEAVREEDFGPRNIPAWHVAVCFTHLPRKLAGSIFCHMPNAGWTYYTNPHEMAFALLGVDALPAFLPLFPTATVSSMRLAECFEWDELAMYVAKGFLINPWNRTVTGQWLLNYPAAAARGLLPAAFGEEPVLRYIAHHALHHMSRHGKEAIMLAQAERYGSNVVDALQLLLNEPPQQALPEKLPAPLKGLHVPGLPRLYLKSNGKALPLEHVQHVLTMMALCKQNTPFSGFLALQEALTPESLAKFGQALFEWWRATDPGSKGTWIFWLQPFVGNDETARQLNIALKQWRAALSRVRAYEAMEMLVQIGSDMALMYLHQLSEQTRYNDLQERSSAMIVRIAEQRGLNMEQLADRTVPDLGLDEHGRLVLDFGPRSFQVRFDEHLTPYACDSAGKRIKDLPKPNSKDDEAVAKASTQQYKDLKKQVKNIASAQIKRLEAAMCGQRRWTLEEFEALLVRHPLLRNLTVRLVWGSYDAAGQLVTVFRVAEDLSYTDADDNTLLLPEEASIGIPHRLELSDADVMGFGQLFADYELLQPFDQLGRATYHLEEAALDGKTLPEWSDRIVTTGALLGLEGRGWTREEGESGSIAGFSKALGGERTVTLCFYGDWYVYGQTDPASTNTITRCVLTGADGWRSLSPLVVSEIQRDLYQMNWTS